MNSEKLNKLLAMAEALTAERDSQLKKAEEARGEAESYREKAKKWDDQEKSADKKAADLGEKLSLITAAIDVVKEIIEDFDQSIKQEREVSNGILRRLEQSTGIERCEIEQACEQVGAKYEPPQENAELQESGQDAT